MANGPADELATSPTVAADVSALTAQMKKQRFPILCADVGIDPMLADQRQSLLATIGLEPALNLIVRAWAQLDIATTTNWQVDRVQLEFVDSIEAEWAADLKAKVTSGHVMFVPRSVAQLVREVLEYSGAETTLPPSPVQVAHMLLSINTEHNATDFSPTGTVTAETMQQIVSTISSFNVEQSTSKFRELLVAEVASALFDAPLKLEVLQGNAMDTWFSPWPPRASHPELGAMPADAFRAATQVPLIELLRIGSLIAERIRSDNQLRFSRSELIRAGADETAVDYCIREMAIPLREYRACLRRDRRRGPVEQQRYTMTRYPFLRVADDELLVLRYQWVVDRFFGSMLYWPTFAGLPGFRKDGTAESGSVAEAFSNGMNYVFERAVGDSLGNIVRFSRYEARLITEGELQQKWSNGHNTPSACDWVVHGAERLALVVDATHHHLDEKLAQGLGSVDDYAKDMDETFTNTNEKFDQLGKTMDRLLTTGEADFGLAHKTVFVPVIVVPDAGLTALAEFPH